ncbi:MAG: hypothetical protein AVDCRST_MAG59-5107, partial [uncultured Thermomicrobiales bacterium]
DRCASESAARSGARPTRDGGGVPDDDGAPPGVEPGRGPSLASIARSLRDPRCPGGLCRDRRDGRGAAGGRRRRRDAGHPWRTARSGPLRAPRLSRGPDSVWRLRRRCLYPVPGRSGADPCRVPERVPPHRAAADGGPNDRAAAGRAGRPERGGAI